MANSHACTVGRLTVQGSCDLFPAPPITAPLLLVIHVMPTLAKMQVACDMFKSREPSVSNPLGLNEHHCSSFPFTRGHMFVAFALPECGAD